MGEEQEQERDTFEESEADAAPEPETSDDDSMNEKEEINRLLDEGYSVKQIVDLGFKRRTAYHHAKKRVKPENEPASGADTTALGPPGKAKYELLKLGSKDTIPPEAVLEVLHLPQNGDAVEVWRRGVLDGVGFLLLGARYSQLTASGQAEIVKNQLDIMREAKEGNKEIAEAAAQQAAQQTAAMMGGRLGEMIRQTSRPESPNPMASMVANAFQPFMGQALQGMFQAFSRFMPGMMPGMMVPGQMPPGQAPVGSPQQPQPGAAFGPGPQSGPVGQISREQIEEAFNDD